MKPGTWPRTKFLKSKKQPRSKPLFVPNFTMLSHRQFIKRTYEILFKEFGPQHWWPGESPLEVIVGAILTQNTNWGNVEKAIRNLKSNLKPFHPSTLHKISERKLAQLIRPAGYFNLKAKRLKNFVKFLFKEYDGQIEKMKEEPLATLRAKLLMVNGIGPETADSILLYALDKPAFVIDAYTKRFLYRHNIIPKDLDYHDVQKYFEKNLDNDRQLFNEYHALIVRLGKNFCKPTPKCEECVLKKISYNLKDKCPSCHRAYIREDKICRCLP
jgi:endonuclease-3 related protein